MSSETLYKQAKWSFQLVNDTLPDGTLYTRPFLDHAGAAVIIPIMGDGKILMIRQFRPSLQKSILELPAGGIEKEMDPLAGALRELREETGYRAKKWAKLTIQYPLPGLSNELMHYYVAKELTWDPLPMDADEQIENSPIPLEELVAQALQGEMVDSKSVVGILLTHYALQNETLIFSEQM